MKRFAQILNDKVHYVFESKTKPELAKDIILVDITKNLEVKEGWNYNIYEKTFSEPEVFIPEYIDPIDGLTSKQKIEMIELLMELEVI